MKAKPKTAPAIEIAEKALESLKPNVRLSPWEADFVRTSILSAITAAKREKEKAFSFEDHCSMMDAKHPKWRTCAGSATSYTAVAKEFWEAALASQDFGEKEADVSAENVEIQKTRPEVPPSSWALDSRRLLRSLPADVIKKLSLHDLKRMTDNYNTIPCPNCYGGHQRPCQWCGDSGVVTFVPDAPSVPSATPASVASRVSAEGRR